MQKAVAALAAVVLVGGCQKHSASNQTAAITPGGVSAVDSESPAAGDGPFGLNIHAKLADLPVDSSGAMPDQGFYPLKSVPNPNSNFQIYTVIAFDGVGICEIRAVSPDFQGDDLGTRVRATADTLADTISSKYGKAVHTDECGSTCDEQFWSMSMGEGNRTYSYDWGAKAGNDTPRSVSLWVRANNLTPYIRLDYSVNDANKCAEAAKRAGAKNL